jgi:hypothetical protein
LPTAAMIGAFSALRRPGAEGDRCGSVSSFLSRQNRKDLAWADDCVNLFLNGCRFWKVSGQHL